MTDKAELTKILTYHVASGKFMAADVKKLKSIVTVQGQPVKIELHRLFHRGVKIDDAQILHPDIECTTGVIHVIDSVLMPK